MGIQLMIGHVEWRINEFKGNTKIGEKRKKGHWVKIKANWKQIGKYIQSDMCVSETEHEHTYTCSTRYTK